MTAKELIALLATMPPDARVWHLWDGGLRTEIEHVWLARSGAVATADNNEVCYDDKDRPSDAPTSKNAPYWGTPEGPECSVPLCGMRVSKEGDRCESCTPDQP